MVARHVVDSVLGLEERLDREASDVLVVDEVEDPVPVTAGPDDPGEAQLRQVLRHRGWVGVDVLGQLVDAVLAVQQRPQDPQPGLVRQQLQHTDRGGDLLAARFMNLRIHADSLRPVPRFPGRTPRRETDAMASPRSSVHVKPATIGLVVLGLLFVVVAIVYFTKTATDLPSFMPGHQSGVTKHHTKHGIALLGLAALSWIGAWFTTAPPRS